MHITQEKYPLFLFVMTFVNTMTDFRTHFVNIHLSKYPLRVYKQTKIKPVNDVYRLICDWLGC